MHCLSQGNAFHCLNQPMSYGLQVERVLHCPRLPPLGHPGLCSLKSFSILHRIPLCWTCHSPNADGRSKLCKSNAKGGNWLEHNWRSENATNQFLSPCFSFFICKIDKTIPIRIESKSWWLNEKSILNWEFWTVLIYFNFPFCSSFLISTHLS